METDSLEMMALCLALLEHVGALAQPLSGVSEGAITLAQSELMSGIAVVAPDAATAESAIDAIRPMVAQMPAADLEQGAAFCVDVSANR